MQTNPFSEIGRVQRDLEQKLRQKVDTHEIHKINSVLGSLECTIRELRAHIAALEFRLSEIEEARH